MQKFGETQELRDEKTDKWTAVLINLLLNRNNAQEQQEAQMQEQSNAKDMNRDCERMDPLFNVEAYPLKTAWDIKTWDSDNV